MTTNYQDDLGHSPGGDDQGSPGAKERAQEAAGTAKDQTQHVAGVASEELGKVTSEAKGQLQGLLSDATSQVDEQSRAQKSRLSETLRSFGDDLDGMAQQQDGSGPAQQVVQQVAQQAKSLASHLDEREPQDLIEDVRRFARRRPGTFLLGALAAGVVVGRLTRGAKAAQDGTSSGAGTTTDLATGAPAPVTVGTPGPAPVAGGPSVDAGAPVTPVSPGVDEIGYAPEPRPSLGEPGPGRDVLVDPLAPADDQTGFPSSGGRA